MKATYAEAGRVFLNASLNASRKMYKGNDNEALKTHKEMSAFLHQEMPKLTGWSYEEWRRYEPSTKENADYNAIIDSMCQDWVSGT